MVELTEEVKKVIPNTLFIELSKIREDTITETQKKVNELWKETLKDFDIIHKEYSKAKKDTITSPKFIERKVNSLLSNN